MFLQELGIRLEGMRLWMIPMRWNDCSPILMRVENCLTEMIWRGGKALKWHLGPIQAASILRKIGPLRMQHFFSTLFDQLKYLWVFGPQEASSTKYQLTWDEQIEEFLLYPSENKGTNTDIAVYYSLAFSESLLNLSCNRIYSRVPSVLYKISSQIHSLVFGSQALNLLIPLVFSYFFWNRLRSKSSWLIVESKFVTILSPGLFFTSMSIVANSLTSISLEQLVAASISSESSTCSIGYSAPNWTCRRFRRNTGGSNLP